MQINLHANAKTTPAIGSYIQNSPLSVAALAQELGVSETTIRRWKARNDGRKGVKQRLLCTRILKPGDNKDKHPASQILRSAG